MDPDRHADLREASVRARGVDLLEFVNGKITRKDSFWKLVE
jgi:hypothetical protein